MYVDDIFEKWYENISNKFKEELIELEEISKKEKERNISRFKKSILILLVILAVFIIAGINIMRMLGNGIGISILYSTFVCIVFGVAFILPILIVIILTNHKESNKKRIAIRKSILNIMTKSFDNLIEYYPKEGIAPEIYNEADVEHFDSYDSNHLMSFSVNGNNNLKMAETIAQYIYTNGKGESEIRTTFAGTFATLNIPKPFKERVYIKKDMHNGNDNNAKKLPYKDMRIELDSQEFEEKFDVYASNQIVAMQLLTSDIMLMLNAFYKYMQREFEITIKNDTIYIRIWNGNTFSNSLIKNNELDKELIYKNYRTINFILNISSKLVELINEIPYL